MKLQEAHCFLWAALMFDGMVRNFCAILHVCMLVMVIDCFKAVLLSSQDVSEHGDHHIEVWEVFFLDKKTDTTPRNIFEWVICIVDYTECACHTGSNHMFEDF